MLFLLVFTLMIMASLAAKGGVNNMSLGVPETGTSGFWQPLGNLSVLIQICLYMFGFVIIILGVKKYGFKYIEYRLKRDLHPDYLEVDSSSNKQLVPYEIPPPPSDFTGREDEVKKLLELFDHGATIIGLRGMGGIGKTALAFKLAKELADRYPDGQIFINIGGTDPNPLIPSEAMAHIIRAYNPEAQLPESESDLSAVYHKILHDKHTLLLLDNANNDKQIRPLLPPDTCGVIVTSRLKIAFEGLVPIDMDVLEPEEAMKLLLKIRRPNQPPVIPPQEEDGWEKIAELCGYLPLALRAAGSSLANRPDISLDQYIKQLGDERTRLDSIGEEGVDRGVEASFNISYGSLPAETAQVFRMLSIFPADFDAKAEEVVCLDKGHKHLSELVRWNLVEYHKENDRYRLHDLSRLFAFSHLEKEVDKASIEEIKLHHAEHYETVLTTAESLYLQGGENILAGLKLLDLEWPNIKAGQSWAEHIAKQSGIKKEIHKEDIALYLCSSYPNKGIDLLILRLHPRELIHWLETALYAARKLDDQLVEAATLTNIGIAHHGLGEYSKSIEFLEQALTITREKEFRYGEGSILGSLGNDYLSMGQYPKSTEFYEQARIIFRDIKYKNGEMATLLNLGNIYRLQGKLDKSLEFYEQALAIARELKSKISEGSILAHLGTTYRELDKYRKSIDFFEQALTIAREIGYKSEEGSALDGLGNTYEILGESLKAIQFHEQALAIFRDIGHRNGEGSALANLGHIYLNMSENHKAIVLLEQAIAIFREIGDREGEGRALVNISIARYGLGERGQAIADAELALNILEKIGSPNAEKVRLQLAEWKK